MTRATTVPLQAKGLFLDDVFLRLTCGCQDVLNRSGLLQSLAIGGIGPLSGILTGSSGTYFRCKVIVSHLTD